MPATIATLRPAEAKYLFEEPSTNIIYPAWSLQPSANARAFTWRITHASMEDAGVVEHIWGIFGKLALTVKVAVKGYVPPAANSAGMDLMLARLYVDDGLFRSEAEALAAMASNRAERRPSALRKLAPSARRLRLV